MASSIAQGVKAGRILGQAPYHHQMLCEEYFTALPTTTPLLPLNPKLDPRMAESEIFQLLHLHPNDYHLAFWQTYQRPTAGK